MRSLISLPLCLALAIPAGFTGPGFLAQAAPESVKSEEAARAAYTEGTRHYEIGNYEQALESWVRAYSLVPDDEGHMEILGKLRLNIARAHEKIFELHGDPANLRRAKALLETHIRVLPDIYVGEPALLADAQQEAEDRLARIEALLGGSEPGPDPAPVPVPANEPEGPQPTEPAPELEPIPEPSATPAPAPIDGGADPKPGKGLVIAGSVLTVLGAGGIGLMIAGMATASAANDFDADLEFREDQIVSGRRGNIMSVAGAITGGLFLVTGVTLLMVGVTKNKRARMAARLSPSLTGLTLHGRF
jgi:tetratricopeptide (TPR) repeat protein